ncbi:DRAP deaminase [Coemansia sp. RSA 1813]|nr:DRAP deaminase [Coemansia sp. RSA 1646]KAJ1766815.1 DRAP deaminase [Coemansia sp. RSA 1843]KAJ2088018.1 DRAP deaminase [Coemansia sp. RSA 986]KAJ2211963.1 DRAP deaminase [Coemansia sp. RSA 487]KAJ2565856.1 DRAP deaminase [Coemansia sp. RSA 1813]
MDIYYEEDGLQRIHPYYHKYATHAKGRWVGRSIFQVFSQEFRDRSADYYEAAIRQGLIELNGAKVDPSAIVRNGDLVTHYIHRHEPPVGTTPIGIVSDGDEDDGLLVIDKPPSLPVHPSGRYNYNSVIRVLELKHGYSGLFPVNRLDRLTSGLMLIALNAQKAREMEVDFRAHRIQKEYICKVKGDFPAGHVVCDQPIRVVAHKLSLNCVDSADGKPSMTEFRRLSGDGTTSIVYCRPKTGRTHQIRVHLQFLGYPIANDPLYCNEDVWGRELGKGGNLPDLPQTNKQQPLPKAPDTTAVERPEKMAGKRDNDTNEAWLPLVHRMEEWKTKQELVDHVGQSVDDNVPRMCPKCSNPTYPDPTPDELSIWLHAWRYSGPGWTFETPLPAWAQDASDLVDSVKYHSEK